MTAPVLEAPALLPLRTGLVVEDLPAVSDWLAGALRESFPGIVLTQAYTLREGLDQLRRKTPDIALVDLGLPDGSGLRLIEALNQSAPSCACIVTTIFQDDQHLFPALRAGAQGYLLKDQPREQLVAALQGMVAGEPPLSPAIARRLLKVFAPQAAAVLADTRLSPREREALGLIAKGCTLAEVAAQQGVTHNTAAGFIKSVYRKLNISSRAEATVEAARMGLIRTEL